MIILHSVFWISWISSFTLIQSLGKGYESFFTWLMYYLITLPIFITHTYLIGYWLLPCCFFKNRIFLFGIWALILLVVFSIAELIVSNELVFKQFSPSMQFSPGYLNIKNILVSGLGNHYIILVFLAIKAGKSWYNAKTEKDDLARQNLETEIEIFRYQLQPKFVLDLIEELEKVAETRPQDVPDLIVKISEFMNHLLFDTQHEMIPVTSEVEIVDDFLRIQKEVAGNRVRSNITVSGNLSAWMVPPLIISPFLSGLSKNICCNNQEYEINVVVKSEKKYLLFSVTIWSEKEFSIKNENLTKIINKRLNYIFPGKYRIIENIDANFTELSLEIYH